MRSKFRGFVERSLLAISIACFCLPISPATWAQNTTLNPATDAVRSQEASNLLNQGVQLSDNNQPEEALQSFLAALEIYRQLNNRTGEVVALQTIGFFYSYTEQYQQAIEYYQQALIINRELADYNSSAYTRLQLGSLYQRLSEYEQAIDYYDQALLIYRLSGNRDREIDALSMVGYGLMNQNQPDLAIDYFRRLVQIHESMRSELTDPILRQLFMESTARDYLALTELLRQQNGLEEAQQILDLLR